MAYCGGHLVRIEQLTNGSHLSRNLNFSLSHSHAVMTFTETNEILTTEYRVRVQTSYSNCNELNDKLSIIDLSISCQSQSVVANEAAIYSIC